MPGGLTLTVADNGDSTATLTVSGSSGGTVNQYYATADNLNVGTWTAGTSRVGDGAFPAISTGNGYFFGFAEEPTASKSGGPLLFRVTDGTDPVFERFLDWVQTRCIALSLPGIANGDIIRRKVPWDRDVDKPGVVISPIPETIQPRDGDNLRDITSYGALVTVVAVAQQDLATEPSETGALDESDFLQIREDIRRGFQNQTPPSSASLSEVSHTTVEAGSPRFPDAFLRNLDVQSWTIRAHSYETRT